MRYERTIRWPLGRAETAESPPCVTLSGCVAMEAYRTAVLDSHAARSPDEFSVNN
jgi:hypothetical protein